MQPPAPRRTPPSQKPTPRPKRRGCRLCGRTARCRSSCPVVTGAAVRCRRSVKCGVSIIGRNKRKGALLCLGKRIRSDLLDESHRQRRPRSARCLFHFAKRARGTFQTRNREKNGRPGNGSTMSDDSVILLREGCLSSLRRSSPGRTASRACQVETTRPHRGGVGSRLGSACSLGQQAGYRRQKRPPQPCPYQPQRPRQPT
jgi:hypothetical protein